jgi:hypothetical protein
MGILEDAIARRDARPEPRRIDYARMQRVYPRQKAALTRAIRTGDAETIAKVCKAAVQEWNEIGAWPDGWNRWQIALDDVMGWNNRIELEDL